MSIPPRPSRSDRIPPEGVSAQIEFMIQNGDNHLELVSLVDNLIEIERFRSLSQTAIAFGLWLQGARVFTRRGQLFAFRYLQALRADDDSEANVILGMLASEIILTSTFENLGGPYLKFEFVGAHRTNPTGLRFFIKGGPYAISVLAGICGFIVAHKEIKSEECLARIQATEIDQSKRLERIHRREGRWTKNLAESHARVLQSSKNAALACHRIFPNIEVIFSLNPKPQFEIRIKNDHQEADATQDPAP